MPMYTAEQLFTSNLNSGWKRNIRKIRPNRSLECRRAAWLSLALVGRSRVSWGTASKKRLEICKALSCRTIEIACLVNVGITNRSCRESLRYRNYVPIINFVAMIQFDSFFFCNFLIHKTLELKYILPKTNLAVFPLQMNQILIPEQQNPVASNDFNGTKVLTPHPKGAWSWKFDWKHPSSRRNQRLVSLASCFSMFTCNKNLLKWTDENHLTMKVVYIWYLQPIKGSFYVYICMSHHSLFSHPATIWSGRTSPKESCTAQNVALPSKAQENSRAGRCH